MIAVIDVTGNNLTSIGNAIDRLGFEYSLTHDPRTIEEASHVILPGVGTVGSAMDALEKHHLVKTLSHLQQPLLGICVGMQLLFEQSEEASKPGLGLLPGRVKRLPAFPQYSIPHMGWNSLRWTSQCELNRGLNHDDYFYFVHSYAYLSKEHALARSSYSSEFTAVVQKDHIYGVQFHPEKSARAGMVLLNNFLTLRIS